MPGSSLLSGGPGPVPPWSENDQTLGGENPKSDNLRPETGAVAWSIRGAGSSRQVEVAWQAPSSLPYTAPPPLHHRWKTRAKRLLSLSGSSLQTDRPSCQTSWGLGEAWLRTMFTSQSSAEPSLICSLYRSQYITMNVKSRG